MFRLNSPTSTPPAGDPATDLLPDVLLHELRSGERDGFLRYHGLYRAPVYDFAWRLLGDESAAVAATDEALTTVYRRVILDDGPVPLRAWTYQAALAACNDRLAEREGAGGPAVGADAGGRHARRRAGGPAASDLGRRLVQTLASLESRYRVALLLHDVPGLSSLEIATVFAMTEEAADALLFRAREAFRRAFEGSSSSRRLGACRLAERSAAGAVGRGLTSHEARVLHEHARYCRHCRRTMKGWGESTVGLGLFLETASPPRALTTSPVFAAAAAVAVAAESAKGGLFARGMESAGHALKSKASAYTLALICLALVAGLAIHRSQDDGTFVVVTSAGPNVALIARPAAGDEQPSASPVADALERIAPSLVGLPILDSGVRVADASGVGVASAGGSPVEPSRDAGRRVEPVRRVAAASAGSGSASQGGARGDLAAGRAGQRAKSASTVHDPSFVARGQGHASKRAHGGGHQGHSAGRHNDGPVSGHGSGALKHSAHSARSAHSSHSSRGAGRHTGRDHADH